MVGGKRKKRKREGKRGEGKGKRGGGKGLRGEGGKKGLGDNIPGKKRGKSRG